MPCVPALPGSELTADQATHLILPFAACACESWWPTLEALPPSATAHLRGLLRQMRVAGRDQGQERSLSPPHERVLARALGLPDEDGKLPWAALAQGREAGSPWGFVTACHWAMGREHATLSDPQALQLSTEESDALLASMRPFFEGDGLSLQALAPGCWRAQGQAMAAATASLDRVMGRNVDPWLPSAQDARLLRRLQNEMQMLLYTHPVNEARQQRRKLTANSIWFSGTGVLPHAPAAAAVHLSRTLAQPALAEDWAGYAQAWAEVDAQAVAPLLRRQQSGQAVRLSLCGERGSLTLETAPRGLLARLQQTIGRPAWPTLLQGL